jgi:hypothetical protein
MEKNKDDVAKRLLYLADEFQIFSQEEVDSIKESESETNRIKLIPSKLSDTVLAIVETKLSNAEKGRYTVNVRVADFIFSDMIQADPSENKEYLQWMLNIFRSLIKDELYEKARQFGEEDLKMAKSYLDLFSKNKRKKRFHEYCLNGFGLPKDDPSNINQYKSLSQLFDAVDPFIEREPSNLERMMYKYVENKQALIPFKDRKFTVYIPLTRDANCVMGNFASWCTAQSGNSMFNSYTTNNKQPNGKNSNIYVIINNDLFLGKSKECYQIHFESGQIKGRENGANVNLYEPVLSKSDGISEYFKSELTRMAKDCKEKSKSNYIDYLIKFGFSDALFDMYDPDKTNVIKFERSEIPKLPDLSRFKEVDEMILIDIKLAALHPSIGMLTKLELLSLPNNNLNSLPKEIGNLKNLFLLNIKGNKITDIPDEIKYLDKTNGGSLFRVSVNESDIGKENIKKLKKLLPTAIISNE